VNVRTSVASGLNRILKEVLYVGGASLIALFLYRTVAPRLLTGNPSSRYEAVKRKMGARPVLYPGRRLTLSKIQLVPDRDTLLVFTSPFCSFCRTSAKFHQQLLSEARRHSIPAFVVVPDASETPEFLSDASQERPNLLGWLDVDMRPVGTPTVVLIDSNGVVRMVWTGLLGPATESDILGIVRGVSRVNASKRGLPSGEPMLKLDEIRALWKAKPVTIISIAERATFKNEHLGEDVLNIPFAELSVRADFELRRSVLNVVDCTTEADSRCQQAVGLLANKGFQVAALDRSQVPATR
jgi:hypothetical protein